jgi:Ni/Co efflux regulator RcnB
VVSETPRPGTQPPLRTERRRHAEVNWSTNWRNDHRYDWRDWRRRHRSHFHLGFYFDPFGWGYQPYSIGWRMWPSYFGSRYWINDPWQYRLPYAPPGYRWVRYYDDAILVDTWTGEVVDVIYNFFW